MFFLVLLFYTYFQNHKHATQFPYHGGSYSDLGQCPLDYRLGHWLLSDVTPEPQTLSPPPSLPHSPLSLLVPVWQQAPLSLPTHSQSCTFHPSLVHSNQWIFIGSTPEWSDCEVPALVGIGDLPVIKGQVLGLPFLAAA